MFTRDNSAVVVPIKIADNVVSVHGVYFITEDSSMWSSVNYDYKTGEGDIFKVEDNVVEMSSDNGWCTYILRDDHSLWAQGANYCYGFSQPDLTLTSEEFVKIMNNVKSVSGGDFHTAVLKTDGTVWTFGLNYRGQLGNNSNEDSYKKVKAMEDCVQINTGWVVTFAFKENGELWRWGNIDADYVDNGIGNVLSPTYYAKDAKQICSKCGYSLALKNNGELWMYGENDEQLEGYAEFVIMDSPVPNILKFHYPQKIMDNVRLPDENNTMNLKQVNFTDLPDIDEMQQAVTHLAKAELIEGVTETKFMPYRDINRAETAELLLRIVGKDNMTGECGYTDVMQDKWYYDVIGASQKYGIINGFDDNTFRGEETVSELQLVSLAARTLSKEGTATEPETDQEISVPDNIPEWAEADVAYALKYEIITEEEAKKLSDEKGMTRGDAAVILYRLYNII